MSSGAPSALRKSRVSFRFADRSAVGFTRKRRACTSFARVIATLTSTADCILLFWVTAISGWVRTLGTNLVGVSLSRS